MPNWFLRNQLQQQQQQQQKRVGVSMAPAVTQSMEVAIVFQVNFTKL